MAEPYPGNPIPPHITVAGDFVPGDKYEIITGDGGDGPAGARAYRHEPGGDSVRRNKVINGAGLLIGEGPSSAGSPQHQPASSSVANETVHSPGVDFKIVEHVPGELGGGGQPDAAPLGRLSGGIEIVAVPEVGKQTVSRSPEVDLRTRRGIADAAMRNLDL